MVQLNQCSATPSDTNSHIEPETEDTKPTDQGLTHMIQVGFVLFVFDANGDHRLQPRVEKVFQNAVKQPKTLA